MDASLAGVGTNGTARLRQQDAAGCLHGVSQCLRAGRPRCIMLQAVKGAARHSRAGSLWCCVHANGVGRCTITSVMQQKYDVWHAVLEAEGGCGMLWLWICSHNRPLLFTRLDSADLHTAAAGQQK